MNYIASSLEPLTTESDDGVVPECPVHGPLLPPVQPRPGLRPPGQQEVSGHHREPEQAQAQHQPVSRESRDAEILEEAPPPLGDELLEGLAVCPEVSQAEGHTNGGLDHQGQQEQGLLVAGQLHCWERFRCLLLGDLLRYAKKLQC